MSFHWCVYCTPWWLGPQQPEFLARKPAAYQHCRPHFLIRECCQKKEGTCRFCFKTVQIVGKADNFKRYANRAWFFEVDEKNAADPTSCNLYVAKLCVSAQRVETRVCIYSGIVERRLLSRMREGERHVVVVQWLTIMIVGVLAFFWFFLFSFPRTGHCREFAEASAI